MSLATRLEAYARAAVETAEVRPLEDGTYVARVPGLTGVAAFGDTETQTLEELYSTVEDWARFQRQRGVAMPCGRAG